jgi:hypothetical protein
MLAWSMSAGGASAEFTVRRKASSANLQLIPLSLRTAGRKAQTSLPTNSSPCRSAIHRAVSIADLLQSVHPEIAHSRRCSMLCQVVSRATREKGDSGKEGREFSEHFDAARQWPCLVRIIDNRRKCAVKIETEVRRNIDGV